MSTVPRRVLWALDVVRVDWRCASSYFLFEELVLAFLCAKDGFDTLKCALFDIRKGAIAALSELGERKMDLVVEFGLTNQASDLYDFMRTKERKRMEYRGQSPQLGYRRDLVRFIGDACVRMHLSVQVHHLATHLLDFFMDAHGVEQTKLKLLSAACLVVAAKAERIELLDPTNGRVLLQLLDNAFTIKQIADVEGSVLFFFNWDVYNPTIATFLDCFRLLVVFPSDVENCQNSPTKLENLASSLKSHLTHILGVALEDYSFVKMPASMVAAACVVSSRMRLRLQPVWSPVLENMTTFRLEQLQPIVDRLLIVWNDDNDDATRQWEEQCQALGRKGSQVWPELWSLGAAE